MSIHEIENDEWRAKGDCCTLVEANEIKKDRARYKAAMAYAKKKHQKLADMMKEGK